MPVAPQAVASTEQYSHDCATISLLSQEFIGVIIGVLSSVLVLQSGLDSRAEILCRYDDTLPKPVNNNPAELAIAAAVVASISLIILSSAAFKRYQQRKEDRACGLVGGSLWPNILICVGFVVSILATALKNLGVGQRVAEDAQTIIF